MTTAEKTLLTLQQKEVLVEIFTDRFSNSFYGYIRKFNEEYLLLELYNSSGDYNGIMIFRRCDITRLKWNNNNTNSTLGLIARELLIENLDDVNIESIENIVRTVNDIYGHITLQVQNVDSDICLIGQIVDMDSENLVMKEFGTRSTLDRGMLMIGLDDITRVEAAGIYERSLLKIFGDR